MLLFRAVLDQAYARNPERFVRACPKPSRCLPRPGLTHRDLTRSRARGGNESSDDRPQNALKIPAREGGIFAPKENVAPPFPANPRPPLLKPASEESRHSIMPADVSRSLTSSGENNKAKVTMRRSYGFRTFRILELALYHSLGKLPEPELTHEFF